MEGLKETIDIVLDVRHKGGHLLARDASTFIVTDYECTSQKALQKITDQHPNVHIAVCESNISKTGYMLVFTYVKTSVLYKTSSFIHIALTCACIVGCVTIFNFSCLMW